MYSFMTLQLATAWQRNASQLSDASEMRRGAGPSGATHLTVVARGQSPPATGRHDRRLEDATRKDLVLAPLELRPVEEGTALGLSVPSLSRGLCADGGLDLIDGVSRAATRACSNRTEAGQGSAEELARGRSRVKRMGREKGKRTIVRKPPKVDAVLLESLKTPAERRRRRRRRRGGRAGRGRRSSRRRFRRPLNRARGRAARVSLRGVLVDVASLFRRCGRGSCRGPARRRPGRLNLRRDFIVMPAVASGLDRGGGTEDGERDDRSNVHVGKEARVYGREG